VSQKAGTRTYMMMQPYVREPILTLTVGLYKQPKTDHDQDRPIGEVLGSQQGESRSASGARAGLVLSGRHNYCPLAEVTQQR
jgi:hypothetical protein